MLGLFVARRLFNPGQQGSFARYLFSFVQPKLTPAAQPSLRARLLRLLAIGERIDRDRQNPVGLVVLLRARDSTPRDCCNTQYNTLLILVEIIVGVSPLFYAGGSPEFEASI